jgi:hydrogenase 3 maturation protease
LSQSLTNLKTSSLLLRIAVIGIGHELRGDDAAGVFVARALRQMLPQQPHILVIDAGSAPENHTGSLRRFSPDLVLLVDSAVMDDPPGSLRWLADVPADEISGSTHTLPPYVLIKYLKAELGCDVAIIGIQPVQTALGESLSQSVREAVDEVVRRLASILIQEH